MGAAKRTYGAWSREMLRSLRENEELKVEAFVAWLDSRGVKIDRTLLSHWFADRSHLPADLLPHLAQFTGRPELVYGPYLKDSECELVHLQLGPPDDRELTDRMLEVGASLGRIHRTVIDARLPDSEGGEDITETERQHLVKHISHLIHQLAELRARLEAD